MGKEPPEPARRCRQLLLNIMIASKKVCCKFPQREQEQENTTPCCCWLCCCNVRNRHFVLCIEPLAGDLLDPDAHKTIADGSLDPRFHQMSILYAADAHRVQYILAKFGVSKTKLQANFRTARVLVLCYELEDMMYYACYP
jgi:hypothetical protein